MASRWHVIRTESRAEYLAAGELDRDGFEVFFPRVTVAHPRKGHADAPLFPGYLFLRCNLEGDGRPSFTRAHRVLGWVRFGGDIPWLPDRLVAELKLRSEDGGLRRQFRPGELVRIEADAVQGIAKVVEDAKSSHSRVNVLLEFMGRSVPAQVPWESLQPIEEWEAGNQRVPRRTRGRGRWVRGFGPSPAPSY